MSQPEPNRSAEDGAAQAVLRHHAQLAAGLQQHTESLLRLVENQYLLKAERARQDLLAYLRREIVPHAQAEERTLYPAAAHAEGRLLVDGMLDEHRALTTLVEELAGAGSLVRAAAAGRAFAALFATHLAKENNLLLPLLVAAPDTSLADLLAGMHDLLGADEADAHEADAHGADAHGADAHGANGHEDGMDQSAEGRPAGGGCGGGSCGCGGDRPASSAAAPLLSVDPRLDLRDVPHGRRHELVLSTVEALAPGQAVVLVASHAPRPVLAEIDDSFRHQVEAQWLQSGPDVWQVRLERLASTADHVA